MYSYNKHAIHMCMRGVKTDKWLNLTMAVYAQQPPFY